MAGERKGKAYEAVVRVALQQLKRRHAIRGEVFWNETPKGMTIEPDFTIGRDRDCPDVLILVTHSGSQKDSEKKFWRNIGELAEAKVVLPSIPRVYNVIFDATIKEDLKELQGAAFDGQLIVGERPYGKLLLMWVDGNAPRLPADAAKKTEAIVEAMRGPAGPGNPRSLIEDLTNDLADLLKRRQAALDGLWAQERKRTPGKVPAARNTFLRRGVGKLLLLDGPEQLETSGKLDSATPKVLVEALKSIGLARATVSGTYVTDSQMLWARRTLSVAQLRDLFGVKSEPRMQEWVDALRGLAAIQPQLQWLSSHWDEVQDGRQLFQALKKCHADPSRIAPTLIARASRRVWLYHLAVEWIKLSGKTRTEFGGARLLADLRELAEDTTHRRTVAAALGQKVEWRSDETVRLGLSDWQSAGSEQTFSFTDDDLARVADALARRLRECSKPDPVKDLKRVTEAIVQSNLEAKLLTYRNFKPFEGLLRVELEKAGLKPTIETAVRACFADAAVTAGAKIDPRSSGTTVMRVKNTLINWQSVSDAGRDHKKKELCGRAAGLRYSWDAKGQKFVPRAGVKKLVLVLDGTWRQEDLAALVRAGWDEVFYPEELDRLTQALV